MAKDSSPKTDQMRALREQRVREAEARARGRPPVDARVNEKHAEDPNGRGGKTKIKVPKRDETAKARRDNYPVPATDAAEGVCQDCGKIRALRNGKVVTHSYPPLTRQVCPGAGHPPKGA